MTAFNGRTLEIRAPEFLTTSQAPVTKEVLAGKGKYPRCHASRFTNAPKKKCTGRIAPKIEHEFN